MSSRVQGAAYSPPPDTGLDLVYSDQDLIVVNKPSGLLSVPGRGAEKLDCMAARVQLRYNDALIVHRLDMETSGLLLLARGAANHRTLSMQFQERKVSKRYEAIAAGCIGTDAGSIDAPMITDWPNRPRQIVDRLIGKPSLTHFRVLDRDPELAWTRVELEPITGRSHQLRVHLQFIGHPILGDALYAGPENRMAFARLALHATHLSVTHPRTNLALRFHSPAPFY